MGLHILYVDESGVPARHPSQTSHYALAGVAIPADGWATKTDQVQAIRAAYGFPRAEIHVAWMLRPYPEQAQIPGFATLPRNQRFDLVSRLRARNLNAVRQSGDPRRIKELERFYRQTTPYIHLTYLQREQVAIDIANLVGSWPDVTLFGEVADKTIRTPFTPDESAFEQVLTRYEAFLGRSGEPGIVAYDANETVATRFTALMAQFQAVGGLWRRFRRIAGHPFFVPSHMSDLIQVADVLAYGLRRYAERRETRLFSPSFGRFDRIGNRLVGLRHYRGAKHCTCLICREPR